ncbi:MAG: putative rane-bound ClpP-class protease associated with aq [Proteobacteria bacterium]|nr:putative rane-bound ClpP-class protease associated with aq [Pseudomonadota bacterium]
MSNGLKILLFFASFTLSGTLPALELLGAAPSPPRPVLQLQVDGPIGPATSDYLVRSLDKAAERNAALVIIRMDTPGGLDTAMRDIIKKIIASPVPVATYVAPGGARAASAGTYILYASHIAAMAPGTNLGAATPVQITAPAGIGGDREKSKEKAESDKSPDDAMTRKMVNDAVAYLQGLAKMRGRNAQWAEKAVRQGASLPAEEALALKVVDLIALDTADLLRKLDGHSMNVLGQEIKLALTGTAFEVLEPDWRSRLLAVITNPNVAYILMLIGIYGLILEFYNPGAVAPGTIGAICLLLALYAFQVLPVNYAGLALIILGIGLMIAEAFAPSFGVLGLGGATAFVIGSVILMDTDVAGFAVNPGLVAAFTLSSVAFFVLALGMIVKSRNRPVVSGREEMIGSVGVALEDFDAAGQIRVHGEIWSARTVAPMRKGQQARVSGMDGLTLLVEPVATNEGD